MSKNPDHDILAGAQKPEIVKPASAGIEAPNWLGRPLVHPDHAQELERHAAINEFGHKMPRAEAEEAAYGDYVKRQRELAAAHHLAGMKAAHGAGDMEAARKHGMMYAVHTKALGHEPVGPVPPGVLAAGQQKVYKFKPHKGDLFAVQEHAPEGVVSSPPPPALGKSELLEKANRVTRHAKEVAARTGRDPDYEEYNIRERAANPQRPQEAGDYDDWYAVNDAGAMGAGESMGREGLPAGRPVPPSKGDLLNIKQAAQQKLVRQYKPGDKVVFNANGRSLIGTIGTPDNYHARQLAARGPGHHLVELPGASWYLHESKFNRYDPSSDDPITVSAEQTTSERNMRHRQLNEGYGTPGVNGVPGVLRTRPQPAAPAPQPAVSNPDIDPDDPMGTGARTSRLELSEREALYQIWLGTQAVLAKGNVIKFPGNPAPPMDRGQEASATSIAPGRGRALPSTSPNVKVYDHTGRLPAQMQQSGHKLFMKESPEGRVVVLHKGPEMVAITRKHPDHEGTITKGRAPGAIADLMNGVYHGHFEKSEKSEVSLEKKAPPGFSEATMHKLKAKHGVESAFKIAWAAYEKGHRGGDTKKAEYTKFPEKTCPVKGCGKKHTPPVNQRTSGPTQVCPDHAAAADKVLEEEAREVTKKAELPGRSKPVPCRCSAYSHPHRTGGGKCKAGK